MNTYNAFFKNFVTIIVMFCWKKKDKSHFRYFGSNPIDINNNIFESWAIAYFHVYIKMMDYAPVSIYYDQTKEYWAQTSEITQTPD